MEAFVTAARRSTCTHLWASSAPGAAESSETRSLPGHLLLWSPLRVSPTASSKLLTPRHQGRALAHTSIHCGQLRAQHDHQRQGLALARRACLATCITAQKESQVHTSLIHCFHLRSPALSEIDRSVNSLAPLSLALNTTSRSLATMPSMYAERVCHCGSESTAGASSREGHNDVLVHWRDSVSVYVTIQYPDGMSPEFEDVRTTTVAAATWAVNMPTTRTRRRRARASSALCLWWSLVAHCQAGHECLRVHSCKDGHLSHVHCN